MVSASTQASQDEGEKIGNHIHTPALLSLDPRLPLSPTPHPSS